MERGLEPLLRIGQVILELSAQSVLAIKGAVMRRRRQEVLFNALNCQSRDRSMPTKLFPSLSNQPKPSASEHIFICANQGILFRIMAFPSNAI